MKLGKVLLIAVVSLLFCFSGSFFSSIATTGSTGVSLGAIQNISNNGSGNSTAPVVAAVGSHVYVAWAEKPASNKHIATYFIASSDNGISWSPIIAFSNMNGGADPHTSAVQIAAEQQFVFLTWEQGGQTAYAISSNYGATFPQNGTFTVPASLGGPMSGEAVSASGSYGYFSWAANSTTSKGIKLILFVQAHYNGTGFTFTPVKQISSTTKSTGEDQIASQGNNVYVVWDSIWVTASNNNGATFTTPKDLTTGTGGTLSREPMVATCGKFVYVTFLTNNNPSTKYQAFVAVNNNSGAVSSWTTAKDLSISTLSNIREVQVNCNGNNVYITSRGQQSGVKGTQQYAYISNNNGATFAVPMLLGPALPGLENGFGGIASSGNQVYITWVHFNESKAKGGVQQVFIAASQDNGTAGSWAPNQQISNSKTGVLGYGDPNGGQGPLIAAIPNNVYIVWEDNITGNSQIMFASGAP